MKTDYQIYLAGEFIEGTKELPVVFPYDGTSTIKTSLASREQVEIAIQKGLAAEKEMQNTPVHVRSDALLHIAQGLKTRRDEFAMAMVMETAKPLQFALAEVDRAILTFTDGAEEAKRIYGEYMPLDRSANLEGHDATVRRFPVGLVAAIAPFNFPLNLVAHKLAPAIAAGCPIILKPASKTPLSSLLLAELISETMLPKGAVSILPMDRIVGDMLVTDNRFKLLTFTGSPDVGWDMKARAGKKKVVLELGGNAAVIISAGTDLKKEIRKISIAAFGQSGQSCIHTQRIYVHESLYKELLDLLTAEAKLARYGDPRLPTTVFSSMIDTKNADRIKSWVDEAVSGGAKLVFGGNKIDSAGYEPTILTNTKKEMKVCSLEAFAPIVVVESYTDFKDVVAHVNDSAFGLQCGLFSNDLREVTFAFENLEVGGVIVNNVSNFRADHMPYGGVKDSGLGREGVRYAIEDMTERRVLVINKNI